MDTDEMTLAIAEASPDVSEVQLNLGITLQHRGDVEGAAWAERKALSLHPMDPETQLRASMLLAGSLVGLAQRKMAAGSSRAAALAGSSGDWQLELDHVRRARDSLPDNPDVDRAAALDEGVLRGQGRLVGHHVDAGLRQLPGPVAAARTGLDDPGPGEVLVRIRGGTESFVAWSVEPLPLGATVLVTESRGSRQVEVIEWADPLDALTGDGGAG